MYPALVTTTPDKLRRFVLAGLTGSELLPTVSPPLWLFQATTLEDNSAWLPRAPPMLPTYSPAALNRAPLVTTRRLPRAPYAPTESGPVLSQREPLPATTATLLLALVLPPPASKPM